MLDVAAPVLTFREEGSWYPRARTIHQWKPTLIADDRDALLRALKGKMGRLPLYDVYEVKAHESS